MLADSGMRDEFVRRTQLLQDITKRVVSEIEKEVREYVLPRTPAKSENQAQRHRERLGKMVASAIMLVWNLRASRRQYCLKLPSDGESFDEAWMEAVGGSNLSKQK